MFYQLARNYLVRRCCSLHGVMGALLFSLISAASSRDSKGLRLFHYCGFGYLHDFLSHFRTRTKSYLTHLLALALYGNIIPDARESLRLSLPVPPSFRELSETDGTSSSTVAAKELKKPHLLRSFHPFSIHALAVLG